MLEGDDRQRQAVDNADLLRHQVQLSHKRLPQQRKGIAQLTSPSIEPALARLVGKQVPMGLPILQHLGLHIPAAALADQYHRQQLAVTTDRFGSGRLNRCAIVCQ